MNKILVSLLTSTCYAGIKLVICHFLMHLSVGPRFLG